MEACWHVNYEKFGSSVTDDAQISILFVMVALLWSANLGAVYPFVEVVLTGHSLHDWVEQEADKSEKLIADREQTIADLELRLEQVPAGDPAIADLKRQVKLWCRGSRSMRRRLRLLRWLG